MFCLTSSALLVLAPWASRDACLSNAAPCPAGRSTSMGVSNDDPLLGVTVVLVVELLDLAIRLVGTSGWVGCSVLGVVVAVTGGVAGVVAGVVEELGAPTEVWGKSGVE